MSSIAENYRLVCEQIKEAAIQAKRPPEDVLLLAVSKTRHPLELRSLSDLGQRDFGENYLQEALDKQEALADLPIIWHFIGPIQSNKTRAIAENFAWVHSVDRLKVAQRLSAQRPAELPPLNICIQINVSNEASKAGCSPNEAEELLNQIAPLSNLKVRGLMAIPEATDDEHKQALAFEAMNTLFHQLKTKHPELDTLSMGMSADMQIAIKEGATIVRIGTALFGPRMYSSSPHL